LIFQGFKLAATRGAARSIAKYRPRLASSLDHKWPNLFEIPIYLKTNFPVDRFYPDHHTIFRE
jgi:hypothetical protein